jgi:hypothetical protein
MTKIVETLQEIDGYTIIRGFSPCPIDPEATKAAVAEQIDNNPSLANSDLDALFDAFAVYSENFSPGRRSLTEEEYSEHKALFDGLGEHELLAANLQKVPCFKDVEYWLKTEGRWAKNKIEHIGQTVPQAAVLNDALTQAQREEIGAQREADRIAALDPEAKEAEKQARLDAAAVEADKLSRRATIRGTDFNAAAWYAGKEAEIEAKYA